MENQANNKSSNNGNNRSYVNLNERRELRLQGIYNTKSPVYVQGRLTFSEALIAFKAIGDIQLIQSCSKGSRITIWDRKNGWGKLEENILRVK